MTRQMEGLKGIAELFLKCRDKESIFDSFDLFLTPEEKNDLAMRYLIIKELLKANKPQREVAQQLNVSIAKITRGSNELKRLNKKTIQFLRKHLLK